MGDAVGSSLILIINTLGSLLILAVLLRFLLQAVRADFYNPLSQAIVKITTPLLNPLRKIIPGFKGIDFASLALALILNTIFTVLIIFIAEPEAFASVPITSFVIWSGLGVASFILKIYFYGMLISIVASWVAPSSGNPVLLLLQQLLQPIQSRIQRIIPPMGGLDFSPIFLFLGLRILDDSLLRGFAQSLRLPAQYVIGI